MTDLLRLPIKLAITIALCFFISNCGIPIETSKGTFTIDSLSKEERRRNHQDPSRMAEELEHDRRAEISKDIRKQNIKENSAREKRLNEIIDKQLHHQQEQNHQPSDSQ